MTFKQNILDIPIQPAALAPKLYLLDEVLEQITGKGWMLREIIINFIEMSNNRIEITLTIDPIEYSEERKKLNEYDYSVVCSSMSELNIPIPPYEPLRDQEGNFARFFFENSIYVGDMVPTDLTIHSNHSEEDKQKDIVFTRAASIAYRWMHNHHLLPSHFVTWISQVDAHLYESSGITKDEVEYRISIAEMPFDAHEPWNVVVLSSNFTFINITTFPKNIF